MQKLVSLGMIGCLGALAAAGAAPGKRVVVWSEGTAPKSVYPDDINTAVSQGLVSLKGWDVATASLDDPEQGLTPESLERTDVLLWWGHQRHGQVSDDLVARVVKRVKDEGMGFIALHSSHFCKPLKQLLGTPCSFGAYLGDSRTLRLSVKDGKHPIAAGVQDFEIPHSERYSEPFAVPTPEAIVFDGLYTLNNGETDAGHQVLVWTIGKGKVIYVQAGHETNPTYFDENIRRILRNAVQFAAPR